MLSHAENSVTSYTSNRPGGWLTMPITGSNEIIMLIFVNEENNRALFEVSSDSENTKTEDLTSSSFITSISYDHGKTYENVTQHHLGPVLINIDLDKINDKDIYTDKFDHTYKQAFVKVKLIRRCLKFSVHHFTRVMEIRCGECLYLSDLLLSGNPYIKFFSIGRNNITNLSSTFAECTNLDTIVNLPTEKVELMNSVFRFCYSLKALPTLDMSSCKSASAMFASCHSLKGVSLVNTFAVQTWSDAFSNCINLIEAPIIDTMGAMIVSDMFRNCNSLQYCPEYNFSNVTFATDLFNGCISLESIPKFDFKSLNTIDGLFANCPNVTSIPPLNTSFVKTIINMDNDKVFDSIEQLDIRNLVIGTDLRAKHITFNYGEMESEESFIIRIHGMTEADSIYEMITSLPTCKEDYRCTLLLMDYKMGLSESMIEEANKRNWDLTIAADNIPTEK